MKLSHADKIFVAEEGQAVWLARQCGVSNLV